MQKENSAAYIYNFFIKKIRYLVDRNITSHLLCIQLYKETRMQKGATMFNDVEFETLDNGYLLSVSSYDEDDDYDDDDFDDDDFDDDFDDDLDDDEDFDDDFDDEEDEDFDYDDDEDDLEYEDFDN